MSGVVEEADLAEYDYSGMQTGQAPQIREFKGEQMFTGAILEMVEARSRRSSSPPATASCARRLSPPRLSQAQDLVGRDNFAVETWARWGKARCRRAPTWWWSRGRGGASSSPRCRALTRFLVGGGRVLLLLDPILGAGGLERTGFGIVARGLRGELGEDIVVDPTNPLPFYSAETFFANEYGVHPITEALRGRQLPGDVLAGAQRRHAAAGPRRRHRGDRAPALVADAWGETDLTRLDAVAKDDADVAGPVGLGVAVEIGAGAGSTGGAGDGSLTVLDDDDEEGAVEPSAPSGEAVEPAEPLALTDEPPAAAGATAMAQEPPAQAAARRTRARRSPRAGRPRARAAWWCSATPTSRRMRSSRASAIRLCCSTRSTGWSSARTCSPSRPRRRIRSSST